MEVRIIIISNVQGIIHTLCPFLVCTCSKPRNVQIHSSKAREKVTCCYGHFLSLEFGPMVSMVNQINWGQKFDYNTGGKWGGGNGGKMGGNGGKMGGKWGKNGGNCSIISIMCGSHR